MASSRPRRGSLPDAGGRPACAAALDFGGGAPARAAAAPPAAQPRGVAASAGARAASRAPPTMPGGGALPQRRGGAASGVIPARVHFAASPPAAAPPGRTRGEALVAAARSLAQRGLPGQAAQPRREGARREAEPARGAARDAPRAPPAAAAPQPPRAPPPRPAASASGATADVAELRREIKEWERSFLAQHGRSPRKSDAALIPAAIMSKYQMYVRLRGAAKGGRAEEGAASPRSVGALGGLSLSGERSWGGSVSEAAAPPPPPPRAKAAAPRRAPRLARVKAPLQASPQAAPPAAKAPAPRTRPPPKRRLELPELPETRRKTRRSL